jgi:hypothetical protein
VRARENGRAELACPAPERLLFISSGDFAGICHRLPRRGLFLSATTTRKSGGERQRFVTRHKEVVRIAQTSCEAELTPLGSWFWTLWANAVGNDRRLLLRASAGIHLPAVLDEAKAARRIRCRSRDRKTGRIIADCAIRQEGAGRPAMTAEPQ